MIKDALASDGVEEIFKLGNENANEQDIFDEDYLAKLSKIKLPNTKIKLLQQLLAKIIGEIKKINKVKGIDFTKKMQALVERYNQRDESDILRSEVYEEMAEQLTNLIWEAHKEFFAGDALGIDFEEKAFYDILKDLCIKYDFKYPDDKLIELAKAVKELVDSQAKFPDWNKRDDIKSSLKVGLILLLDEFGYPPVERDEVYVEIFEQAENFKKYSSTEILIIKHRGSLFLDTDDFIIAEEVFHSYKNFVSLLRLEFVNEGEFVKGSWIRKAMEFIQKARKGKNAQEIFNKGQKALELAYIEKAQSEVNRNNAEAASAFITSIKDIPNVVSIFGSLILVKATINGVPQLLSKVSTTNQLIELEKSPELMNNPLELLRRLNSNKELE